MGRCCNWAERPSVGWSPERAAPPAAQHPGEGKATSADAARPEPGSSAMRAAGAGLNIAHLTSVHARDDTRVFHKMCGSLVAAGHSVTLYVADGEGHEQRHGVELCRARHPRRLQASFAPDGRTPPGLSRLLAGVYGLTERLASSWLSACIVVTPHRLKSLQPREAVVVANDVRSDEFQPCPISFFERPRLISYAGVLPQERCIGSMVDAAIIDQRSLLPSAPRPPNVASRPWSRCYARHRPPDDCSASWHRSARP